MEPQPPQKPAYTNNWFDRHKVITCFAIVALFFLSVALFNRSTNQTAVQGASTEIPTATPTLLPTDTPAPTATPSPTAFISPTQPTIPASQPPTQAQVVQTDSSSPAGATAKCADGTYSFSQHRSGTCSHHGGVAEWL
jgi:Protein of unknown function (DUF3761)